MKKSGAWLGLVGAVVLALAVCGPIGCGGGDDDDDAAGGGGTTTIVVTNVVNGTTVTNTVVVTNVPAGSSILNVVGTWTGNFETDVGTGQLQLQLLQDETTIIGQFRLNTGGADQVGNLSGDIDGDHVVLGLVVTASGLQMELDGHVNAGATSFIGNLSGDWSDGQFALHK